MTLHKIGRVHYKIIIILRAAAQMRLPFGATVCVSFSHFIRFLLTVDFAFVTINFHHSMVFNGIFVASTHTHTHTMLFFSAAALQQLSDSRHCKQQQRQRQYGNIKNKHQSRVREANATATEIGVYRK